MKLTNYINKITFCDGKMSSLTWDLVSVKQINFFVGPNNSGKSRQLRNFSKINKKELIFDTNLFSVEYLISQWKLFTDKDKLLFSQRLGIEIEQVIKFTEQVIKESQSVGVHQLHEKIMSKALRRYSQYSLIQ
ncbi:hypothetical protein [Vibrio diabolicus]|uniref:hypothetical protein n=1 Tax=Vibrio diabolicus TaxID=50719 RepID=UPI000CE9753F|nr:hypothetical protein [Vibrio diabolicus]AVF60721.1 hypothetical protein AL537_15985 [Vibrio diabolicus]